ncbi:MAG TPA: carboxypeptidase-like regulatory domain-containing protein, partial [Vicinamibacterales bacterium]|nr:carboxypeptidase-like regulatory domain-containing protein [Vicinamibacterales bacterium]
LVDAPKPIELLAAQTIEKIDFALPRGAVIAGHVFDEFGEPSANVSVTALRFQYDGRGRRRLSPAGAASSNDLGEFRIFALAPGDYYLSVLVGEFGDSIDRASYAPLYYPGTTDVNLAELLTVASGQTMADLSLTLQTVRTARVSGTAADADSKPMPGFVVVNPLGAKVAHTNVLTAIVQPDGSFTVGGLTPGEYRFVARGLPMLGSSESVTASATVTVGTNDIAGVRVVAGKPAMASGKVVVAGDPRTAGQVRRSTLRLLAAPDDDSMDFSFSGNSDGTPVNDDGSFQIALQPGRTRLLVIGTPPEWSMKAVRLGGVDVTDTGIDVKPAEDLSNLEIELTDRINQTIGLVANERNEPVKDYLVVIFSKDRQ